MTNPLPIAMTCGEPAGIGPELAVAAKRLLRDEVPFFWIGDPRHLPDGSPFEVILTPSDAAFVPIGKLPVLAHDFPDTTTPGQASPRNAQSVIDVITRAVDLTRQGAASAICTAPIHKQALQSGAGFAYPGHTEYLAHLGGDVPVIMMLASDTLRVVPVTIHIPLSEVSRQLTSGLLEQAIRLAHSGLIRDFAIPQPRLAVAGLNPHAGEGGAMGEEEITIIRPLVRRLAAEGMQIVGPMSADTMFHARARTQYDAAICMYHDQALIPIKTLDFDGGVNVTLGLPFIRTSPDHGTGFDIAGKGIARPDSLIAALRMAARMAKGRAPWL